MARAAYGAGSGEQEAVANCAAMRHKRAAATVKSRFETARAAEAAMRGLPEAIHLSLRQGPGHEVRR